ncbi:phage tail tape measure protein [Glycomyces sp. NPDC048151]|uniref:phage tail tape measure protein n=1 Tax=Glycomyces sp. NPDC048151 TaxID=3364002 RepID=UPI00372246D3
MAERTVSVALRMQMAGAIAAVKNYRRAWVDARDELQKNILAHRDAADQISHAAMIAGAGLAAGVGLAVAKFAEFDAQMSNVNAVMRETDANMEMLREAALKAGETTVFSATEAAQAIEELGKAGISTADILGGGLDGALSLAAAGGMAVADAAEVAALAMQQFGLSGNEIPHVADLLAAAAGKSLGSVDDLRMALQQSGLVANQFGLSIEDTTGALAAFASAGLIGSDAGTSLKTMLTMLANPSKESAQLMEELGINAYDASGQFVGLTNLAGQLESQMGGLTQAQRDQALAQIFGTDALRAANVLYEEGSAGIRDWNLAVNDSGYAAEVAADRMDNLQGDLKTLQSTLETALIQSGSGANDALRSMTQNVTNAVQAFSSLPEPVQQAAVWVGAAGAAITLLGGAAIVAVPKVHAMNVALTEMGTSRALLAKKALGGLTGFLFGPWGAALGIAVAALGAFAAKQAESKAKTDQLADTLDQQTGAITENTRAMVAKELEDQGAFEMAKKLGVSQAELVDSVLYGTDAFAANRAEVNRWLEDVSAAGGVVGDLNEGQKEQYDTLSQLDNIMSEQQGTFSDAQERQENLSAAIAAGTESAGGASAATQVYADALGFTAESATDAQSAVQELDEAFRAITETLFAVEEAEDAVARIVNEATEQFEENGGAMSGNSEEALDNRDTILSLIDAYLAQISAVAESTGSQEDAIATAEALEAEFRALGRRLGLTEDQIDHYAQAFDAVPDLVETVLRTTYVTSGNPAPMPRHGGFSPAYADGGYVPGFANGGIPRFPTGGLFHGRGGPREDANIIAVSDGEFIVNAASTARYRSLLEAINSGRGISAWAGMGRGMNAGYAMAGMGVERSVVRVSFDFSNVSGSLERAIKDSVRINGNGNVQVAFGSR